jgi:hypothetical protein
LSKFGLGRAGEVFCVTQDPARTLIDGEPRLGFGAIVRRSFDVYHTVHTAPIIAAMDRINRDVKNHKAKLDQVKAAITGMLGSNLAMAVKIGHLIDKELQPKQHDIPMTSIVPSIPLGETLDFKAERIRSTIKQGYTDFVQAMIHASRLSAAEGNKLQGIGIFRD